MVIIKKGIASIIAALVAISTSAFPIITAATTSKTVVTTKSAASVVYPKAPPAEKLYDSSIINDDKKWGTMNAHDPSIYKDGSWYYTFSTDVMVGGTPKQSIQIRKSKDLIHWQFVGYALNQIPLKAFVWTHAQTLWAPDITKIGDTYYLYYAASQFGTNQSYIGLATSKNVEGPYKDQGEVYKTDSSSEPNAIDPNIVRDAKGNLWMAYGSFFGGIYISKINPKTGKLLNYGEGKLIAKRSSQVNGAVEGPYITYNPDTKKYYLFVSYDSLFTDYNVRVGRSSNIDGPYVDYNGLEMTDTMSFGMDVGNKILGGYKFGDDAGWIGPGHNSVLHDGNNYYIVHHARGGADKNWPYLQVRKIVWSADGWPMVSPERYAGETEQKLNKSLVAGTWQNLVLDKYDNSQLVSQPIKLLADGKINAENSKDHWEFSGDNTLKLYFYDSDNAPKGGYWIYTSKMLPAWDWENWRPTLVYTGINQKGVAIWGRKN